MADADQPHFLSLMEAAFQALRNADGTVVAVPVKEQTLLGAVLYQFSNGEAWGMDAWRAFLDTQQAGGGDLHGLSAQQHKCNWEVLEVYDVTEESVLVPCEDPAVASVMMLCDQLLGTRMKMHRGCHPYDLLDLVVQRRAPWENRRVFLRPTGQSTVKDCPVVADGCGTTGRAPWTRWTAPSR